ncbi:MAG TPA: methyltransferase domain-containing protein [Beijerinckiaceae bacterium]|jgi:predicted TPR repeat methyltransferase
MPPVLRSSGDLLADRRFAYAQGAYDAGDHAAAAELALQVLELVPGFAPAHALLGRARAALGERDAAVAALQAALAAEPDDALGVRLDLARLGALPPEAAIAPSYVRALFDDYAPRFDKHLIRNLSYRGPELIAAAVRRACSSGGRPFRFRRALDLGCGTGLAARAFEGRFETIEGVDLSPGMLAKARKTHLYERLHEGDLVDFLATCEEASADLVVAADVFVYLASLEEAFRAARRVLSRDGLFAFSVQAHDGEGFVLGEDARYSHGEPYLRALAAQTGFAVALLEPASTRQDRGEDVPGLVAVLGTARPVRAGSP